MKDIAKCDGDDDGEDEDLEDQLVLLHDLRTCHHGMTHSSSFLRLSIENRKQS